MAELVAAGLGQAVPGWVCASLYAVRNPYGPPGCTPVVAEMRCPTTTGVSVDTAPTHVLRYWPITGPGADPSRARVRGARRAIGTVAYPVNLRCTTPTVFRRSKCAQAGCISNDGQTLPSSASESASWRAIRRCPPHPRSHVG